MGNVLFLFFTEKSVKGSKELGKDRHLIYSVTSKWLTFQWFEYYWLIQCENKRQIALYDPIKIMYCLSEWFKKNIIEGFDQHLSIYVYVLSSSPNSQEF